MSRLCFALLGACLLALSARPATAHQKSSSYSSWTATPTEAGTWTATVTFRARAAFLAGIPATSKAAHGAAPTDEERDHFLGGLRLGPDCQPNAPSYRAVEEPRDWVARTWTMVCAGAPQRIETRLFAEASPGHLHYARWRSGEGPVEAVLGVGEGLDIVRPGPLGVRRYAALGVEHILSGYDHLAFVLLLVLAARAVKEAAIVVTGFTVGHSITLGLVAMGRVSPATDVVEALIGLSIVLVGVENVWQRAERRAWLLPASAVGAVALAAAASAITRGTIPTALVGVALFAACYYAWSRDPSDGRHRWAIALLFGLLHGFGFAGVLVELSGESPSLPALVAFNLGVELGQLAVIAAVWPLLRWLRRSDERARWSIELGSAAGVAVGTFWFVTRTFG